MNSNVKGVLKFIGMVEKFFPAPKFGGDEKEEELWLKMMKDMLGAYDEPTLVQAAQIIARTRDPKKDGTMFPKPSECIAACEDILKLRKGSTLQLEGPKPNEWSDGRITLAFDLANGELGRRAAREGWVSSLLTFCRKHVRLPVGREIDSCISDAVGFDHAYRQCLNGEMGEMSRHLAKLGESMLVRREEQRAKVLGEAS